MMTIKTIRANRPRAVEGNALHAMPNLCPPNTGPKKIYFAVCLASPCKVCKMDSAAHNNLH